jgi:UDPglucose 6-dehydrogenase
MKPSTLSFFGMSHLGIVYSTSIANKGFHVKCFDHSSDLISKISKGGFPIKEPQLDILAASNDSRLNYSDNLQDVIDCDLAFLSLDVKTDENGGVDLGEIFEYFEIIDSNLDLGIPLVILSQIPIGFCRTLSNTSKRKIFYQVETLVFGDAIRRALSPERVIVGLPDQNQATIAPVYLSVLKAFDCPLIFMTYESAEICKMAINFLLASSITATNYLAEICELVGADWQEITPALQLDPRIGKNAYLKPGLGISGGNIERDIASLKKANSLQHSSGNSFPEAIQKFSSWRKKWPTIQLRNFLRHRDSNSIKIGLWGLSYKQDTDSIKNSPSVEFLEELHESIEILAFDPEVKAPITTHSLITLCVEEMALLENIDALFILTPWDVFRKKLSTITNTFRGSLIVDPYSLIELDVAVPTSISYVALGKPRIN